jgi:general secretion pathway protein L
MLEQGTGAEWLVRLADSGLPLVAFAPVAAVRLSFPAASGETEKQKLGVARAEALGGSMAEPATLHAVAGLVDGRTAVALVGNGAMIEWLDWLKSFGADPVAILPAGLLLPVAEQWQAATLRSERMIGRGDLVLPDEPVLREALVGAEEVLELPPEVVAERLQWLASTQPLNLRSGRFARRRLFVLDWARVRELAALALLIPLLGIAIALATIIRLNQSSDRLEAETARLASAALGQQVSATAASSALDLRISEVPGAGGSPFVPLAAVYSQVQRVPGASVATLNWRPDGTLAISLAATRTEDVNRILLALQRTGYKVTATSRAGLSGQTIADITVRSAA